MTLAYAWCIFGSFLGVGAVILGLGLGIKARIKLDKPVERRWYIISTKFLLVGGITTVVLLSLSLFLRQLILHQNF